ncbi:hypothetical protein DL237_07340 [Pseudooceanicola sediminis]|uniref:Lipoprotein n=1 Tax=Pseudooceanicola sediminis TaxID=2211117 RepID=A0A399J227_9RHOB|nr:hypothetical protein DL237_07340 [Pseudooceanicola sediminis]
MALAAIAVLSGCAGGPKSPGEDALKAGEPDVTRGAYHFDGPPSLTLITVRNNRTGSGGHTALMINADQRVIFDPAGSFRHPRIRRTGDVLIGIDPAFYNGYKSMHARPTYNVVTQSVSVPPDVAAKALSLAMARGSVGQAQCARSTSAILHQLPGFEEIDVTFFPNRLMDNFEAVTGAPKQILYEGFTPDRITANMTVQANG